MCRARLWTGPRQLDPHRKVIRPDVWTDATVGNVQVVADETMIDRDAENGSSRRPRRLHAKSAALESMAFPSGDPARGGRPRGEYNGAAAGDGYSPAGMSSEG
jgi:hypothetical protein